MLFDRLSWVLYFAAAVAAASIGAAAVDFSGEEYTLSDDERQTVEQIVACEAGADDYEGQVAIALCIRNYCLRHNCTVDEAVRALQISTYRRAVTNTNREAVLSAFDHHCDWPTEEPIEFWCTPGAAERGAWHETGADFVGQYGAHRFYKEK